MKLYVKIEDRNLDTCDYSTIEIRLSGRSSSIRKLIRQLSEDV